MLLPNTISLKVQIRGTSSVVRERDVAIKAARDVAAKTTARDGARNARWGPKRNWGGW